MQANATLILSDLKIIKEASGDKNIFFTAEGSGRIWFQIKTEYDQIGTSGSQYLGEHSLSTPTTFQLNLVESPYDPNFSQLPTVIDENIYIVDPYWFSNLPTTWYFGITPEFSDVSWNWSNALTGHLGDIKNESIGVPAPASMTLMTIGLLGLGFTRIKQKS